MNVLTKTRQGDAYDMVAINKFPIVYATNRSPEDFIKDECIISQLKHLIKNKTTYEQSVLYIRKINKDMSFHDYEYPIKNILEYGEKEK